MLGCVVMAVVMALVRARAHDEVRDAEDRVGQPRERRAHLRLFVPRVQG